jgi:hypothetical protein
VNKFEKLKRHIINTHGLIKIRSGRARGERYSHDNNCNFVMVSRITENNLIKEMLQIADKCFTKEDIIKESSK